MRPGAPLSPGLTEKTRHKPAWFTCGGEVSQRFFRASGGPAGRRSLAPAAGVPAVMIFVRNQNGSHNPDEAMRMDDFELAARVIARAVAGLS